MRGISMSTMTRSTGPSSKRSSASMPSEQMVTDAPSARSICRATIWLVRLSSARRMRAPARFAAGRAGAPPAGRRSTASVPPPGRSPMLTEPPSRAASARTISRPRGSSPRASLRRARSLATRSPCGREARALVGDAEDDLAARVHADREPDRARAGEAHGVVEKVVEDAQQRDPLDPERGRHVLVDPHVQRQPARPRLRGMDRAHPLDELRKGDLLDDRRLAAHGAHEAGQGAGGEPRLLRNLARPFVEVRGRHAAEPRQHRGERPVDVMAQEGHLARVQRRAGRGSLALVQRRVEGSHDVLGMRSRHPPTADDKTCG